MRQHRPAGEQRHNALGERLPVCRASVPFAVLRMSGSLMVTDWPQWAGMPPGDGCPAGKFAQMGSSSGDLRCSRFRSTEDAFQSHVRLRRCCAGGLCAGHRQADAEQGGDAFVTTINKVSSGRKRSCPAACTHQACLEEQAGPVEACYLPVILACC